MRTLYLIGSLRNPDLGNIARLLRVGLPGVEIFDDWRAAGPLADDSWRDYEKEKGVPYEAALNGYAAQHVFEFDRHHLQRSDGAILVLPCGRSGHLELGWMLGQGKPGWVLLDSPERWDVMYSFATGVFSDSEPLIQEIRSRYATYGC